MPLTELALSATNAQQTAKINEIVDVLNNVQRAGTANYLVYVGDGVIDPRPDPDPPEDEQ
jgi:hypothetical protein